MWLRPVVAREARVQSGADLPLHANCTRVRPPFALSNTMIVGLLTQSQTVACWILVVFAWGLGFACAVVRGTFDVRPVLSAQIAMLGLLGAASVVWPDYPGAGPGEAARVVMWLPIFGLFVVELRRANRRNPPLL